MDSKVFRKVLFGCCLAVTPWLGIAATGKPESLPVSLSISGGASKGAYEAGLNWGLIAIMQRLHDGRTATGAIIRPLEMASVAGTSAGGINTLLSALAWCSRPESAGGPANRVDDNFFRNLWLSVDVNRLLPDRADSPSYRFDDATLSRADLLDSAAILREQWRRPKFRQGCRVPFGVVVTRVEPETLTVSGVDVRNQRFLVPIELRVEPDGTVGFYFDPGEYPEVNDPAMILMPTARGAPSHSISDADVEAAMFTTSAFPMGFGRKRLAYCQSTRILETDEALESSAAEDADELICPAGYILNEAEFADGGLFDNIPIGFARTLAESRGDVPADRLPVSYFYLDPGRKRYSAPKPETDRRCDQPDPPAACRQLAYSLEAESRVLLGAVGTARTYELYRELTSAEWNLNLAGLADELAATDAVNRPGFQCSDVLPYFDSRLDCADALRNAGRLLESAYGRVETPISSPFSVDKLLRAGVVESCQPQDSILPLDFVATCRVDARRFRRRLADALVDIVDRTGVRTGNLPQRIRLSALALKNDRTLRVSSLGGPITGGLLGDFGAFLDLKFREYDYYAGAYDAVVVASDTICGQNFSRDEQRELYAKCREGVAEEGFEILGIGDDPGARYVFALKARAEFGQAGEMRFAYDPMPPEDRDMKTIHDGLIAAALAGYTEKEQGATSSLVVEREFFDHLREEGFQPTPIGDDEDTLLAQIMADPDTWSYELVRRMTSRMVALERQSEQIYAAREPDRTKRQTANTGVMGGSAFVLQTATYRYPSFTFAPSTAPDHWWWRNIIPYELDFDVVEGDLTLTWQPTWALTPRTLLGIRGTVGFAGGLFSSAGSNRENFLGAGLDLTQMGDYKVISSVGVAPTFYHTFKAPEDAPQNTFGGDVHIGFLNNRLRLGIGARDFGDTANSWFLNLGLADLPGVLYWLSR